MRFSQLKSGRLRHRSKKREKFDEANQGWRRAFIEAVGYCEFCGCREGDTHSDGHYAMCLTVHELCPGAFRVRSILQGMDACGVACWYCNSVRLPGMKLAKQIALKVRYLPQVVPCCDASCISESDQILRIIAAVRAVRDNGRSPVVVTEADVRKELELL